MKPLVVGAFGIHVGALQRHPESRTILRRRRHAAEHGAITERHQHLAARAHPMSHLLVRRVVDAAFENAHVHAAFVRLLQVGDGRCTDVRQLRNLEQALVNIQ
ncbi:MAG: hypothetical protein MZV64_62835 [Ignavibacteriales bacterium]|nr:hypothetical protein [Ignavibacteriales bacterium]